MNSLLDVFLACTVELAESLQKECLLLVVGEGKSLDGLSGMNGTLLDGLSRDGSSLNSPLVLGDSGGLVDSLMGNVEVVNLSEGLSGLGLSLLSGEAVCGRLSGLVMETGEIHLIGVEALKSGLHALWLDLKSGEILGH